MKFQWAPGFHPPKGVHADDVGPEVERHKTPEALLQASKRNGHCLHEYLWSEGDGIWARRARLEACRYIIRGVHRVWDIGGVKIESRAVEFVSSEGGSWHKMEDIVSNPKLHDAYMQEIESLQEQALRKIASFRALLHARSEKPK